MVGRLCEAHYDTSVWGYLYLISSYVASKLHDCSPCSLVEDACAVVFFQSQLHRFHFRALAGYSQARRATYILM